MSVIGSPLWMALQIANREAYEAQDAFLGLQFEYMARKHAWDAAKWRADKAFQLWVREEYKMGGRP